MSSAWLYSGTHLRIIYGTSDVQRWINLDEISAEPFARAQLRAVAYVANKLVLTGSSSRGRSKITSILQLTQTVWGSRQTVDALRRQPCFRLTPDMVLGMLVSAARLVRHARYAALCPG